MAREYKMRKRAEARDRTRETIVRATMAIHDEKGVASTTLSDIARRAGVGQATVLRHFPTMSELIMACGQHVWIEMLPPVPEAAPAVFAGIGTTRERLQKLIEELDAFYARGAVRLPIVYRDRALVPEINGFATVVEAGIEALVREALAKSGAPELAVRTAVALTGFPVWSAFQRLGLPPAELAALKVRFIECALNAARAN
jgi:AcrR family transcriptional regulator